ncbi:MAG TPA: ABC transporter substrate-binding protein [Myxococcota bacterium]|nr:ABC transporter substrate-binding protein [Myxococcota bacterium]
MILLVLGCTLARYEQVDCVDHGECRETFGLLWVCGEEGLCAESEPHPRCLSTWPDDLFIRPENYGDHILIGSMFDHSSDAAEVQASRLPVMQVSDEGGVEDTEYAMVECSYETDSSLDELDYPSSARETSQWMVDVLGIQGIVGPATSSQTQEAYNATADRGVLIMSPSATSPTLINIDGLEKTDEDPGMLWRTAPPDSLQGVAVAEDMKSRGLRDVAVMYQTGPYGEGLAEVFLESFQDDSHDAVALEFETTTEITEGTSDLFVDEPGLEEVFFISSELTDITAFINAAGELSAFTSDGAGIFLADGAADDQLFEQTDSDLYDSIRGTRPSVPSGLVYETFASAYAAAYPGDKADDSVYTAYAFDATWLVIYGTAWSYYRDGEAGVIDGRGIGQGLRRISNGTEILIRPTYWNDVKARFSLSQGIDVQGASGVLDYDPDTEETTAPIEVWQINSWGDGFEHCKTFCWEDGAPVECTLGTEVDCGDD